MSEPETPPARPVLSDKDRALLRALADIPEDRTTWLVYADWLDDRADPRADFLRLVASRSQLPEGDPTAPAINARIAQLRKELDPQWTAVFDPARRDRSSQSVRPPQLRLLKPLC